MKKLLTIAILLFAVTSLWYRWALGPANTNDQARETVNVESGLTTSQIADFLKGKGLVRSTLAFKIHTKITGAQGALQAGKFVLRSSMTTPEIIEVLKTGKADEMIITIPEGFTVKDIDALFAEKGVTEPGEILACAQTCDFSSFEFLPEAKGLAKRGGKIEGYLYPDTYFVVTEDFVPKFFLERLLTTFRKRVLDEYADELKASDHSLHEIVTMASLVEREALTDPERPIIAGILWKRLGEGLRLDVDATVRYALEKPTDPLTIQDLNLDSPYNCRKLGGLPPGPIASPGLKSFVAVLDPKETPYWYYLHGKDGSVHYAKTNEEHNINKYQYIRMKND